MAVFRGMGESGIVPDITTYNALISALEKLGYLEEATEICREMRDAGLKPDKITYSSLIRCFTLNPKP